MRIDLSGIRRIVSAIAWAPLTMYEGLRRLYLRAKIVAIDRQVKRLVREVAREKFEAWSTKQAYLDGAIRFDPRRVHYMIVVESDAEKQRLASDAKLNEGFRALLASHRYPHVVHFEFESQETVDRDYDGEWLHRLQ